jgi:hypothetical protein
MPPAQPEPTGPIAFLARQAGTAAAFTALLDALEASGEAVVVGALGTAQTAWAERASLTGDTFTDIEGGLEQGTRPRLLITGTSGAPDDDALSWRWAHDRGIPTVAFVDSWVNYAARFTARQGGWVSPLPEVIAVIDEAARQGMREAGLPDERLRVLGSPAFDGLLARRTAIPSRAEGIELLFASQPLVGRGLPAAWNEHAALDLLLNALETLDVGVPITLVLRRHPAEAEGVFDARLQPSRSGGLRLRVDERVDRVEAIASAHAVLGIVSMLQVEAQWLGRPALSIQPGGPAASDLLSLHDVPCVCDTAALSAALTSVLGGNWSAPTAPPEALPRWLKLLTQRDAPAEAK